MPRRLSALAMLLATLAASPAWAGALRTDVGLFSLGDMAGWQPKRFAGRTRYSLVRAQGRLVLRAVTDEIMYALMELSGQEYVDEYAARAKAKAKSGRKTPAASGTGAG